MKKSLSFLHLWITKIRHVPFLATWAKLLKSPSKVKCQRNVCVELFLSVNKLTNKSVQGRQDICTLPPLNHKLHICSKDVSMKHTILTSVLYYYYYYLLKWTIQMVNRNTVKSLIKMHQLKLSTVWIMQIKLYRIKKRSYSTSKQHETYRCYLKYKCIEGRTEI